MCFMVSMSKVKHPIYREKVGLKACEKYIQVGKRKLQFIREHFTQNFFKNILPVKTCKSVMSIWRPLY